MRWVIVLACIVAVSGCDKPRANPGGAGATGRAQSPAQPDKPLAPIIEEPKELARVRLSRDGEIQLDGKSVTLDQLKTALAQFKGIKGVVLLYREKTGATPEADRVLKAIQDLARQGVGIRPVQKDFDAAANGPRE